MVRRGIFSPIEVDRSPVRWVLHGFECDLLNVNINLRRGRIGQKRIDGVILPVLFHDVIGKLAVEKIERLREVVMDRVAVPAVVKAAEFGKKILRFAISGMVFQALVVDCLRPSELVNADHQGTEVAEGVDSFQVERHQPKCSQTEQCDGNSQVIAGDDRVAVLLQVVLPGFVEFPVTHGKKYSTMAADERPDMPLKM